MDSFENEIKKARDYLVTKGYTPGKCEDFFTRGKDEPTLVVHFANDDPVSQGDDEFEFCNTPSTIVAILTLRTGKITIPEML